MKTHDEWIDSLNIPDQEKAVWKIIRRLDDMSNNDLARIGDALNGYEWPDDLPGKPEGWEEMNFDERDPWVEPILHSIKDQLGQKALLRYHHKVNLGKTDQEFEDWWDDKQSRMLEELSQKLYVSSLLEEKDDQIKYESDCSRNKSANDCKFPIIPLLLGGILGGFLGKLLFLLLEIIGVLQV